MGGTQHLFFFTVSGKIMRKVKNNKRDVTHILHLLQYVQSSAKAKGVV